MRDCLYSSGVEYMLDPHDALGLLSNPTPQWGLCSSQSLRLQVQVWSASSAASRCITTVSSITVGDMEGCDHGRD